LAPGAFVGALEVAAIASRESSSPDGGCRSCTKGELSGAGREVSPTTREWEWEWMRLSRCRLRRGLDGDSEREQRTIRAGARAVSSCGSMPMKLRRAYRRRLRMPCGSGRRCGMDSSLPGPRAGTRGGTPWLLLALLGAVPSIEQIDAEDDLDRAVVRVRPAVWRVATKRRRICLADIVSLDE